MLKEDLGCLCFGIKLMSSFGNKKITQREVTSHISWVKLRCCSHKNLLTLRRTEMLEGLRRTNFLSKIQALSISCRIRLCCQIAIPPFAKDSEPFPSYSWVVGLFKIDTIIFSGCCAQTFPHHLQNIPRLSLLNAVFLDRCQQLQCKAYLAHGRLGMG